jgi:hypothetical protein
LTIQTVHGKIDVLLINRTGVLAATVAPDDIGHAV